MENRRKGRKKQESPALCLELLLLGDIMHVQLPVRNCTNREDGRGRTISAEAQGHRKCLKLEHSFQNFPHHLVL